MFLGTPQRLQFSGEAVVLPASPPSVHRLLAAIVASESAFYEGRVSDGACLPSRVGRAGHGFGGEPRGARALPAPRRPADKPGSFTQFNFGESERARIRFGDSTRVRLPRPFPPPSQRGALQAR